MFKWCFCVPNIELVETNRFITKASIRTQNENGQILHVIDINVLDGAWTLRKNKEDMKGL